MVSLTLTRNLYQSILDEARRALPAEAVGIIGGQTSGRAELVISLPNLAGPKVFLADPLAQYQAERRLKQAGLTLLAAYHSHPDGAARLSAVDLAFATRLSIVYVILSLAHRERIPDEVRAYRVMDGAVSQVPICVE